MKSHRKAQVLKRKNFFPTLILTILFWTASGIIIYFIDPNTFGAIPLFFVLIFFTPLFTFSLIFANTRRGFVTAASIISFLILAYFGVGNFLNLILILAIAISVELYFSLR